MNIQNTPTSPKGNDYLNIADMPIIKQKQSHTFTVVIENGEDGYYVGSVPALKGCHTQGKTIDELLENIKEAIELYLEEEKDIPKDSFVGIHLIEVRV